MKHQLSNRRQFIKKAAYASAGLALVPASLSNAAPKVKSLTVLHTNDMHSRIEPFPADHIRYPNQGGMARRYKLIQEIRKETENVLLLDAGDIFQGTPYFNFYGGKLEFELMSKMGYDAATLGNHDFDNGVDGLLKMMPYSTFQFINSNYSMSSSSIKDHVLPYKIFDRNGIKVGIFGLGIQLDGLVNSRLTKGVSYNDPIPIAKDMVKELQTKKCNLIICLSHLGYKYDDGMVSDIDIAEEVSGIDLIIGGHTHTFLKEPVMHKNREGHTTIINQVGWSGIMLGRIDFQFAKRRSHKSENRVLS